MQKCGGEGKEKTDFLLPYHSQQEVTADWKLGSSTSRGKNLVQKVQNLYEPVEKMFPKCL